jgi:ABC-type branched-subunit amino acid transport system ATPase component
MLSVKDVTVFYGGVRALAGCSLEVRDSQIHGLVGPNGSGKTTLLDVVCGFIRPTSGSVFMDGRLISGLPPYRRAQLGIARGFQLPRPFLDLCCLDNLRVAFQSRRHRGNAFLTPREALDLVGLSEYAFVLPRYLSYGQKRLLDLARALCSGARVILLDEPSAGVNPLLVERIVRVLHEVRSVGVSFLVVEHNLQFVRRTCDVVTVLDAGSVMMTAPPDEAFYDGRIRDIFLGNTSSALGVI